jgi:hypothetical protein
LSFGHEIFKYFIVREDLDFNSEILEFCVLLFQYLNNCQHFFVVNLIIAFCRDYGFQEKRD